MTDDGAFGASLPGDFVVAAQVELLTHLGDRLRGAGGLGATITAWAALIALVAAAWWLVATLLHRRSGRKVDNPRRLFRELCRAHRLSWREVALLHELAELHELETPLELFVREDHYDFAADEIGDTTRTEAERLRAKLFAVDEPEQTGPADKRRPAAVA